MAMSVSGPQKSGKRYRANAEINVTPLVDVMLVLMIIFMITAPTLKEGFQVDIPRGNTTKSIEIKDAHVITVTGEGYVLKSKAATMEERYKKIPELVNDLKTYLKACTTNNIQPTVVIVGDKSAKYERIVQVWNAVINAGVEQVSFQLEPGEPKAQL
jgi:biopolymer transport protein TolR